MTYWKNTLDAKDLPRKYEAYGHKRPHGITNEDIDTVNDDDIQEERGRRHGSLVYLNMYFKQGLTSSFCSIRLFFHQ